MSTAAEKAHLRRVCSLGCILCGRPAVPHHIRSVAAGSGTGHKVSDYLAIPLCNDHHTTGGYGVAFHAGPMIWEQTYGPQQYHLDQVYAELGIEPASLLQ